MSPSYFPLRWESTGDQWWFASPLDWAAANGHYDLVRELIRLDANHLIKLTSLRRIRRLETVWDDEEQFDDVAKCRSRVAQKLFFECESKRGKNSLIRAGHGGWLLYTAASAGDLGFARDLLEKNPLLVFGEGEYGVTDILYAAARSKNCEVFRLLFDFAASLRFLAGDGGELEEHIGEIPCDYKWDMVNRAVHAAARGGNLKILKVLLGDCFDVSAYRDTRGSTVLHAAAGRGQVEVVKDLIASFDIINSTDKFGNTALHVASYRGQLAVVEALILASPSSIYKTNKDGETFLHMAVSGFQTPSFRRLDRQIELMKQLVCGKLFDTEDIINAKNNDGRTALHLAIIGNIHSDLVEQIMSVRSIDVNDCDSNGMTPLDLLRKHPRSASSDILTRQLISAGGISYGQDYTASRTIASHLRMRSMGSPGTSFRISDSKIFLYTGIENASDTSDSTIEDCNESNSNYKKLASINYAAERLKRLLHWPRMKERKNKMPKKMVDGNSDENPIPLRQRFASLPNNKRTVSLRSNLPSPNAKKKFASGLLVQGVMPDLAVPRLLFSSSLPKSSISSPECSDKQKCDYVRSDIAGPSCLNQISDKRLMNQYLRFGVSAPKEGLRKKRLGELRQAAKVQRYGSVVPISGSDFVREVSQAPPDVWVVVILYKDGYPECGLLLQCLEQLATKYPATKFVKIISTDCIPNYPDCNLPTLLVYNNGAVKANYVGLHNFGRRCTPEGVALVLCQSDTVLNDGQSGSEPSSREAVLKGVRQRLIEKVVRDHEDDDDGSSSD